jgi:hypothetical protein
MGGIFDLLCLLDGWDYRIVEGAVIVPFGQTVEVYSEITKGWIIGAAFVSDDAYMETIVTMPPETFNIIDFTYVFLATAGLTFPVPVINTTMYNTIYSFPGLPLDSSGLGAALFQLNYPLPLKKDNTVHLQFTLTAGSTQPFALAQYRVIVVQIWQPEIFVKSLFEILNGKLLVP